MNITKGSGGHGFEVGQVSDLPSMEPKAGPESPPYFPTLSFRGFSWPKIRFEDG